MKIEKSEIKIQERNRERKFSRGGSSSIRNLKLNRYRVLLQGAGDKVLL